MTERRTTNDEDADADATGRRIREAALTTPAPPGLRVRLAEQRLQARRRSGAGRARWRLPAAAAGLAAAGAVVLAIAGLPGGGHTAAPSFDDAARLALAPSTAPAPALDPVDTRLVRAHVGGLPFPNYAYTWPQWQTAGARTDRVGGRNAVTVTYRGPRGAVGYTIVDGAPLAEPAGARHVIAAGVRLAIVRRPGTTFVTWRRAGHTCVLATRVPGAEQQLVRFATWA